MSFQYPFTKFIRIFDALNAYLKTHNVPGYDGATYDSGNDALTVITTVELTNEQYTTLSTLLDNYNDPPYHLNFSYSRSVPLFSQYTRSHDATIIDGKTVIQTYIFNESSTSNPNSDILDGVKTVFEYHTPNVQNFVNTTTGSIYFEIFDVTRNTLITSRTIDLGSIAAEWNAQAQTGSTQGSTSFRSEQIYGLMNQSPGYDCIWQFRGYVTPQNVDFDYRINAYQELYYNKVE